MRTMVSLLVNHNPFYPLSAVLLLYGLYAAAEPGNEPQRAWTLHGILAAYTLVLAATAAVIVRAGKVWQDARTIVLLVVLLLVALSMSADPVVQSNSPVGRNLQLAGLAFAVILSEGLIAGLRLRLPLLYRGPYYAGLSLLFLAPLAVSIPEELAGGWNRSYVILLVSPLAGLAMASVAWGVHRGPRYVEQNGTPWSWPRYPLPLFFILSVGLGFRLLSLALSFDPMRGMDSIFAPYLLAPLVLAWGLILLEVGLVSGNFAAKLLGLLLPATAVALCLPALLPVGIAEQFARTLAVDVGSPLALVTPAAFACYALAWLRGVRVAEVGLASCLMIAALQSPQRLTLAGWEGWQPAPWLLLAAWQLACTWRRPASWRWLAAGVCLIAASNSLCCGLLGAELGWQAMGLAVWLWALMVSVVGNDRFASYLRTIVAVGKVALAVGLLRSALPDGWNVPAWGLGFAVLGLITIGVLAAATRRSRPFALAVLAESLLLSLEFPELLHSALAGTFLAKVSDLLLVAGACLATAILISFTKAGLLQPLLRWLTIGDRRSVEPA